MGAELLDWLNLLLRLLHVVTAIAWVGASFYFIWLDLSLEPPAEAKSARGLAGELWAIHGGGIYEVGKYRLEPPQMPETLHWFKWEAYSTWLTGAALMISYYYLRADTQLVLPGGPLPGPAFAVAVSVGLLAATLVLYEAFVRFTREVSGAAQLLLLTAALLAISALSFELFAPRAAILHVGASLGTIMAANVFLGIIPSQKSLVAAIEAGGAPDMALALAAKRRSTHNNYFTLPVLLCMLAGHSPILFAHPWAWLLVPALALLTLCARHYFNLKHRGQHRPLVLVAPLLAFLAFAVLSASDQRTTALPFDARVSDSDARVLMLTHCTNCHARQPTQPGFTAPPGGYVFESLDDLRRQRDLVSTSIASQYMPLGNLTQLSNADRAQLLSWLAAN